MLVYILQYSSFSHCPSPLLSSVPELAPLLNSLLLTGYEPCTLTWEPSRVQLKFLGFLCLLNQGILSRTQTPEAFLFLSKSCKWLDCVWANKVVGNHSKHSTLVCELPIKTAAGQALLATSAPSQEHKNRIFPPNDQADRAITSTTYRTYADRVTCQFSPQSDAKPPSYTTFCVFLLHCLSLS